MSRILVLSSDSGAGHNRVARALAMALTDAAGDKVQVTIADPFQGPDFPSRVVRLYGPAITSARWAWGLLYRLTDNSQWAAALAGPLEAAVSNVLERECPDLVVSVHPLCHSAALRALRKRGRQTPVAVVITDLMDVHLSWLDPGAALYLAPTQEVAHQLLSSGFPSEAVHGLGLPLNGEFRAGEGKDRSLREALGLDSGRPAFLVTGGGEGAGPLEMAARAIMSALPQAQLVVACGRNEALRRKLHTHALPARVLGFVENMAEWVRACDVVIGKAGALTVTEAVAARRPLVIIDALPGQERGNLKYVLRAGIGVHAPPARPLCQALETLESQGFRPRAWLDNMARLDRPEAHEQAARLLLDMSHD